MRYVLVYESADDVAVRAPLHSAEHRAHCAALHERGELLTIGPFGDGTGWMAVFTTADAARQFAERDPFVIHGVVRRWTVREWQDALSDMQETVPTLRSVVLDTTDARGLAEFYRQLLGYDYRPGDEPPPAGEPDRKGETWVILVDPARGYRLSFQQVANLAPSTWPDDDVPQQLHLDLRVATVADLLVQRDRALSLGARLLQDRSDDPREPVYVYADPAGHPFCMFVGSDDV